MKKGMILLLCVLVLLGAGCMARKSQDAPRVYELYFRVADLENAAGGDAIAAEFSGISLDAEMESETLVETLMKALLAGPSGEKLASPFPGNAKLQSVRISAGRAIVDMSTAYGTMSGVELSMADYCIALTLTQIPEVRSVTITVNGRALAHRSAQTFTAREVLISSAEDVVVTVEATLYFYNESGQMVPEQRVLELYEGDTRAETLVVALMHGPETRGLSRSMPEGFAVQSVWVKDERCYVSLSSAMLENLPEEIALSVPLKALINSLLSLENVEEVQFLVDGEATENIGDMNVSQTFAEEMR